MLRVGLVDKQSISNAFRKLEKSFSVTTCIDQAQRDWCAGAELLVVLVQEVETLVAHRHCCCVPLDQESTALAAQSGYRNKNECL